MITEQVFVNNLKSVVAALGDEWLIEMIEYAIVQARQGNWSPMNAVASTCHRANWGSRFSEAMYAIGLFALVKREAVEKREEWKGIALRYRLVPRERARCPETGAILENAAAVRAAIKSLLYSVDRTVIAEKLNAYRDEQAKLAEEKAAELAKRRGSVSFWVDKIERILKDAEKARMQIGPILDKLFERYKAPPIIEEDEEDEEDKED